MHSLADQAAEHAAAGLELLADQNHLAAVGAAVFRVEGLAGPTVLVGAHHVEKHLLADMSGRIGVLQPDDRAAQGRATR